MIENSSQSLQDLVPFFRNLTIGLIGNERSKSPGQCDRGVKTNLCEISNESKSNGSAWHRYFLDNP